MILAVTATSLGLYDVSQRITGWSVGPFSRFGPDRPNSGPKYLEIKEPKVALKCLGKRQFNDQFRSMYIKFLIMTRKDDNLE